MDIPAGEATGQGGRARLSRNAVIILGMHRSGTSALARVVNLLGGDLPKTLMVAAPSNEAGHWESRLIAELNDRILESGGSSWDDWLAFNRRWSDSPKADEFCDEAVELVRSEFGGSRLFILKDPRICRLLPFWLRVLDRLDTRPLTLLPLRNPLEVAASLQRRDGIDLGLGHLLWLRNVLDAEFASRSLPRVFTSYDAVLGGWVRVMNDAQAALGVSWPRFSAKTAEEIEAFLSDGHRHHRETSGQVIDNPALSDWLRESFDILNGWVTTGERQQDFDALDRIRDSFNAAAPAFSRLVTAGRRSAKEARQLEVQLKESVTKLGRAEAIAAERDEALARLNGELAASRHAVEEQRKQSTTLGEQAAREAAAEAKAAELRAALELTVAGHQAQSQQHAEEIANLRRQLSEAAQRSSAFEAELAERSVDFGRQNEEIASRDQAMTTLQAELVEQAERARVAAFGGASGGEQGAALEAAIAEQRAHAERLAGESAELRRQLSESVHNAAALEAALEAGGAAAAELLEVRDLLMTTQSALAQRRLEADEATADLAAARAELSLATTMRNENAQVIAGLKEHVLLLLADVKERHAAYAALETTYRQSVERLEAQASAPSGLPQALAAAEAELEQARSNHAAALQQAAAERGAIEKRLRDRFDEIATLSRLLAQHERDAEARAAAARLAAAREIGRTVLARLEGGYWRRLPARLRVRRQKALLDRMGILDPVWYRRHYEDVAKDGVDPALHYILFGAREGREPNGSLSTN